MKLSAAQTGQVKANLDLDVIDENKDLQKELEKALGEHSFFINDRGLFTFREEEEQDGQVKTARLTVVAVWTDENKTQLGAVTPPKDVDVVFDLVEETITGGK